MMMLSLVAVALAQVDPFPNTSASIESPRAWMAEIRLGPYKPWVDRPLGSPGPYASTFGDSPMLLVELELEHQFFQQVGSFAVGATIGYCEKYGHALAEDGTQTGEATSLRILPMKVLAAYRFDWPQIKWGIPLVPYVKLGFELAHWWTSKGNVTEVVDGVPGLGWSYGIVGAGGLAFLLDVLDQRLARDFDTGMGVNHTYLFAEFNVAEVNNFGMTTPDGHAVALDLSSRFAMFGLAFEY